MSWLKESIMHLRGVARGGVGETHELTEARQGKYPNHRSHLCLPDRGREGSRVGKIPIDIATTSGGYLFRDSYVSADTSRNKKIRPIGNRQPASPEAKHARLR